MQKENFVTKTVDQYKRGAFSNPKEVVLQTKSYFENCYNNHLLEGRERKCCHLSTTQNTLSTLKKRLQTLGAPDAFLQGLRLPKADMDKLNSQKAAKVHQGGKNLVKIPADSMILDCRDVFQHPESKRALRVIALACLTGRRMVELLLTLKLDRPKFEHNTNEAYWAHASGLAKCRGVKHSIDIPLFLKRGEVERHLREVRALFEPPPAGLTLSEQKTWINKKYSKEISRAMSRYCPSIKTIHNFRKFYAAVAVKYFMENDSSEVRLASDYLGHRQTSSTVLTYMNFKIFDVGSLEFDD